MTLAVSLRIPDGIVVAIDSLATAAGQIQIVGEVKGKCAKCGEEFTIKDITPPPIRIPSSVTPFAQKLFGFKGRYGIAHFGNSFLNGQTIHSQVRRLEKMVPDGILSVDEIADHIQEHLRKELEIEVGDLSKLPDNVFPIGCQVSGFPSADSTVGRTWTLRLGKEVKRDKYDGFGCTVSGAREVVSKLWKQDPELPVPRPNYQLFTLQDALDYAEFLIRTTADYQRFANMIPTVGGDIDVALLTPYRGFQWIKSKPLIATLEGAGR